MSDPGDTSWLVYDRDLIGRVARDQHISRSLYEVALPHDAQRAYTDLLERKGKPARVFQWLV